MDNNDSDNAERRNSNTEYVPTKCRITKPPPPKPATNPLQFVKVAPCPLFQKAHEQIKKVEEVKKERKEVREEAEDWQQNLDNWKSSRRKRQEHIIERVVEVKKLEQEEQERYRRKSKTFSEMIEDRTKGRHKFNIPIYDDDSNDLSDYGIGSSSSKTNSIKDVDTDDSCSILDDKDNHSFESPSNRDNSSTSNQSQSEDEANNRNDNSTKTNATNKAAKPVPLFRSQQQPQVEPQVDNTAEFTYEGAIQDYRSRIRSKIHVDESVFRKNDDQSKSKEFSEAQAVVPKGEICKRKELFELDKPLEIHNYESPTSRRLSEDFVNTQSIKQRLKSLEKCTDQSLTNSDKNEASANVNVVKARLQSFAKQANENNNNNNGAIHGAGGGGHYKVPKPAPPKISSYLVDKTNHSSKSDNQNSVDISSSRERCSSPETESYMNKLNSFSKDLDNLMFEKPANGHTNLVDGYCVNHNYTPSMSSGGMSSDREDSGIHTADVSCSVSQAGESIEDAELAANTIPNCIKKLTIEEQVTDESEGESCAKTDDDESQLIYVSSTQIQIESNNNQKAEGPSHHEIIASTIEFLQSLKDDAAQNLCVVQRPKADLPPQDKIEQRPKPDFPPRTKTEQRPIPELPPQIKPEQKPRVELPPQIKPEQKPRAELPPQIKTEPKLQLYENVPPVDFSSHDAIIFDATFPLSPPTHKEPPKVKPPPPPPADEEPPPKPIKRVSSTKRIKREMHIKRSSFLGLDEPTDAELFPDANVTKPPDINTFLQKESKLEKSLYKKVQEENKVGLSKVESHDSGLDVRGRLSSDTWCSGDSSTATHERQNSEPTNSITSEEEEIMKKEREIIEMVEKEEKSRDNSPRNGEEQQLLARNKHNALMTEPYLGSESFKSPYFPKEHTFLDDQDSEVLKVEHELRQLEREELERQRDNILFQESRAKVRLHNSRHSLENIFDEIYTYPDDGIDYRKSMPELQHIPMEYRKSLPDVPQAYNSIYRQAPELDVQYRKSMPDIQHAYHKSIPEYRKSAPESDRGNYRKSMPDLQLDVPMSAFRPPPPVKKQPIMPKKPLRPLSKEQKDRFLMMNSVRSDALPPPNNAQQPRQLSRHSLQSLSAVPKSRHLPVDNWIQPRAKVEAKSYNQHWLFQEAELRRISDQQKNAAVVRNRQPGRPEKHLPDSVIHSLTQRMQNRAEVGERIPISRRPDASPTKDGIPHLPHPPYVGHNQTMGHALPMPYSPPVAPEDSQDRILSVSGKKKCSYCSNELGRGAAMIIESLCLFYHMECFKCCVCHMQLGDGLMGTDVRVRNQKLHCHNCYSSDDGIKFSCV